MKKLIAFSVVFALLVGAAFAEANIGGALQWTTVLLSGDNTEKNDGDTKVSVGPTQVADHNHHINVSFGDAIAGGMFRIYSARNDSLPSHFDVFSFMYWKPIDYFRIQMGHNPDGDWGAAQIVGWGFIGEAMNSGAINDYSNNSSKATNNRSNAFYGGMESRGVNLSFYPLEFLTLNFGFPIGGKDGEEVLRLDQQLADFQVNAVIKIPDIGDARLSFVGDQGLVKDDDSHPGDIYISFYLTAVEALKAEVGFKIGLPGKDGDPYFNAGLGVTFGADAFAVKFRGGIGFGKDQELGVSLGLLPSFDLGMLKAFVYAGLGMTKAAGDNAKVETDYFINPYVQVPAGGLRLYAGLKLEQKGITEDFEKKGSFKWAFQFGFQSYF